MDNNKLINPFAKLANNMKLVAKENPITEDTIQMPHRRHWKNLPSGLRFCFSLKELPGEDPFWHLSVSKIDGSVTQKEIDNLVSAFFDKDNPIDSQGGAINPNVIHFFQNKK